MRVEIDQVPADHYRTLGIAPSATQAEIRAAYLGLMRRHHPDLRPDDAAAADVARGVNAAFEILGDSARRAVYDRQRVAARNQAARGAPQPGRADFVATADGLGAQATAPLGSRAYSPAHSDFSRAVRRASWRAGIAVFFAGVVLLALVGR